MAFAGFEWRSHHQSRKNFDATPIVTWEAYEFAPPDETEVVGKFARNWFDSASATTDF
jgi:hypothetical protein